MFAGVVFLAGLSEATKERVSHSTMHLLAHFMTTLMCHLALKIACAAVAALLQYLFAAALCWMLVSVFLSIMMVAVKENTTISKMWYALLLVFAFGKHCTSSQSEL